MARPAPFGEQLRRLREAAGLSQEALAERAGLTASAIGALERGERQRPYPHTVGALADALGLSGAERATLADAVPARARTASTPHRESPVAPFSPTPLPGDLTRLIGRDREVTVVRTLMQRPGTRLMTLTGPGGVGKTRLAVQVATELTASASGDVAFVPLASLRDPEMVPDAIARSLGIVGGRAPLDGVMEVIGDREVLLLLDNLEQVIEVAPRIAELLLACPGLTVLATSRTPLRLRGEQEYRVPPLGLPDPAPASVEDLLAAPAGRLFVDRALAVQPELALQEADAAAVATICHLLDGLPLALELAAAWLRLFSLDELRSRIESDLHVLSGGARDLPDRQQTIERTIAWSYDLLPAADQAFFRRLATFAGGWTLEAAAAVGDEPAPAALDRLASLVDQSLVVTVPGPAATGRFRMLEPIRRFARRQLQEHGDERAAAERRHAAHFLALASSESSRLRGPQQGLVLDRLEADLGNLRLAMRWLLDQDACDDAARLGWDLWLLWWRRGHHDQAITWMQEILERGSGAAPLVRGQALGVTALMRFRRGDETGSQKLFDESIALFRQQRRTSHLADVLAFGGLSSLRAGDIDAARHRIEEALGLARQQEDVWSEAQALTFLGGIPFSLGQPEAAVTHLEPALALARQVGDSVAIFGPLHYLALSLQASGEEARAAAAHREALDHAKRMGDRTTLAHALEGIAAWWAQHGEPARAARLHGAAESLLATVGVSFQAFATGRVVGQQFLSDARSDLGDEVWESARMEGQAMPLNEAIAYAGTVLPA